MNLQQQIFLRIFLNDVLNLRSYPDNLLGNFPMSRFTSIGRCGKKPVDTARNARTQYILIYYKHIGSA